MSTIPQQSEPNPDVPLSRIRALCCECGNLRTVGANYSPRRSDGNRSCDDAADARGWRMTFTLKCAQCKTPTVHALLRDNRPECRDYAEEQQLLAIFLDAAERELKELHREAAQRRIASIMTAVPLRDLTFEECRELLAVLQPMKNRREECR
jgi:hypothetical protein